MVAGASDCGLSVIETLLLHERLHFKAVTLLAPTGVATAASDAHYTAGLVTRLVSLTMALLILGMALPYIMTIAHSLIQIYSLSSPIFSGCTRSRKPK